KSGNRSTNALPLFKNAGLKNVIHLDGGFDGWRALGFDVISNP
ncbi:MAG: rhodanese-like domain-containing protein, partial [Sneathiella sp.]|nr:rhodanese-like domain-containing protein [Sneathiella sp.]